MRHLPIAAKMPGSIFDLTGAEVVARDKVYSDKNNGNKFNSVSMISPVSLSEFPSLKT